MVIHKRRTSVVVVIGVVLLLSAACGGSSDNSSNSSGDNSGVTVTSAKRGTPVAVELGENSPTDYFLKAVPDSVPAGPVTFTVTNRATDTEHEMVVLKTDEAPDSLKVTNDKVSEDASVGEVSETKAGKTGTVTLDLKAGKYVLVCNVAKHYARHMYAPFTVT